MQLNDYFVDILHKICYNANKEAIMLIEFSITNFLSIRERQTLSMTSLYSLEDRPDAVITPDLPSMSMFSFLKGAAIYGANASGKSNILAAVEFFANYVRKSATEMKPTGNTGVMPFLLCKDMREAPSVFEITFAHKNVRYDYAFSLDKFRILSESLYSYPKGRPRKIFIRSYNEDAGQYIYEFGRGGNAYSDLTEKTRDNALFLSIGVQFNAEEMMPPYEWIDDYLKIVNLSDSALSSHYTATKMINEPGLRDLFCTLLREADLGVADIEVKTGKIEEVNVRLPSNVPNAIKDAILSNVKSDFKGKKILNIYFEHACSDGSPPVKFSLDVESAGTQRLFSLLGPWHDVLQRGVTLFVDELEASMHPLLARKLIGMISGPQNRTGAQLIFTTHNTDFLDASLLRRDQIWFTEKDQDGATHLYSLSDYRPRKDESLQKGYLAGRYGAVPMLNEDFSFYE